MKALTLVALGLAASAPQATAQERSILRWDRAYAFFEAAWRGTLDHLRERFVSARGGH